MLVAVFAFGFIQPAVAATSVGLGVADSFAVLGGSAISNTGSSVIIGDIGSYPTATITGFPPGTVSGTNHAGDAVTQSAKTALTAGYVDAVGQAPAVTVLTELGGTTKNAGIYDSADGTFEITGTLTLDGQGDPNAVFIFKTATTLTTAASSSVNLINGAQPCNVFWQVGSSATLGTDSVFKGNILALTSITATTGASVEGRLLAQNGAVTLDTNAITKAVCAIPPVPAQPRPSLPNPLISVKKVPTPLALPTGPGSVTYDYTVLNIGTIAMSNITVVDNKCSAVTYVSGDIDGDSNLDVNEVWNYRCTMALSQTTTNTVTATGQASGSVAVDTANATVIVGVPIVPPLIHLVKRPDAFVVPVNGGVMYTYTVTNPGAMPLSNVSVVDNKCAPLSGRSGDINNNNMLDISETWTYTCRTNLAVNTVNTAIAEGSANGLTAIDYALATVVTSSPALPNTGIIPDSKDIPWIVAVSVSVITLILISLVPFLRKRVI